MNDNVVQRAAFNPREHLMDLKGKDYLQVAWRICWFRDALPEGTIETNIVEHDAEHAIFKATIYNGDLMLATAHGSETKRDFGDFLEKAETKAIGRALAMCGYGTQFTADELDEGERIADSPLNTGAKAQSTVTCERCGKPITGAKAGKQSFTAAQIVGQSKLNYNGCFCWNCMLALKKERGNGGN